MYTLIYVILMISLLWLPPLIGGNYGAGMNGWEWSGTLISLVVIGTGSFLVAKRRNFSIKWWVVYFAVLANTVLLSFSTMVSAAWFPVPPFSLLYGAVGIVFATAFLPKSWRLIGLVFATGSASFVYSFGVFFSPLY